MTYNLEGVCHNSDGHQLLAVVAAVHHQGVGQSLDDRALSLSESLRGISTGGVRQIHGRSDLDVVAVEPSSVPITEEENCASISVSYVNEMSRISTSS